MEHPRVLEATAQAHLCILLWTSSRHSDNAAKDWPREAADQLAESAGLPWGVAILRVPNFERPYAAVNVGPLGFFGQNLTSFINTLRDYCLFKVRLNRTKIHSTIPNVDKDSRMNESKRKHHIWFKGLAKQHLVHESRSHSKINPIQLKFEGSPFDDPYIFP